MATAPGLNTAPERLRAWLREALKVAGRRDVVVFTAAIALVGAWACSRLMALDAYQGRTNPVVPSAYFVYHGMAVALETGRIGQLDLDSYNSYRALGDLRAEYPTRPPDANARFVDYYSLDIGYAFIVELARLLLPMLPDNQLRVLVLQLLFDGAMIAVAFGVFSRWGIGVGFAAALAYASNAVVTRLAVIPLYYFWDVPISLALLGALVVALHYPSKASALLSASAALLGFAVWLRASWWPLALVYFGLIASSRALRRRLLVAIAIFLIVAAPQAWRSSRARGHFALSTRAAWHVALVGLGYYPNSYGLEANDESVFRLTRERYGITFQMQDYGPHDAAARLAYLDLLRKDPRFVVASLVGRFWESITGTTTASARAYPGIPNPLHRALCLLGFLAMHRRGGARRLVAWLAAAWFVSYVGLTSLFYFVGLAYDNVSQVCLLFLLMGLLEAAVGILARTSGERARPQGA